MAKKVYISFLGTTNYVDFVYKIDGVECPSTRFIQEAIAYHDCQQWTVDDAIFVFATDGDEGAYKKNWQDNGLPGGSNDPLCNKGLETCLKDKDRLNLSCKIEGIKIPEMDNDKDIWKLFEIVNDKIKDYDEIYFDITYAYRFVPMFAMSLFHYSTFVNGTKVKKVRYAMLEDIEDMEEKRGKNHVVNVLDLTPLIDLQDLTYATATYLENGNANPLIKLATERRQSDFAKFLKNVILDFQTCRSIPIVKGEHFKELKTELRGLKEQGEKPFKDLVGKIEGEINSFDENKNVENGYKAAIWCFNNQLYQQAITILRENIVTDSMINGVISDNKWMNGYNPSDSNKLEEIKNYLENKYTKASLEGNVIEQIIDKYNPIDIKKQKGLGNELKKLIIGQIVNQSTLSNITKVKDVIQNVMNEATDVERIVKDYKLNAETKKVIEEMCSNLETFDENAITKIVSEYKPIDKEKKKKLRDELTRIVLEKNQIQDSCISNLYKSELLTIPTKEILKTKIINLFNDYTNLIERLKKDDSIPQEVIDAINQSVKDIEEKKDSIEESIKKLNETNMSNYQVVLTKDDGSSLIDKADIKEIDKILNSENNYELSDRKILVREDLMDLENSIRIPRNDFNHAGFAFGSSTEFPDGWTNEKLIEEIANAFDFLITSKFSNEYYKNCDNPKIPVDDDYKRKHPDSYIWVDKSGFKLITGKTTS